VEEAPNQRWIFKLSSYRGIDESAHFLVKGLGYSSLIERCQSGLQFLFEVLRLYSVVLEFTGNKRGIGRNAAIRQKLDIPNIPRFEKWARARRHEFVRENFLGRLGCNNNLTVRFR